MDPDFGDIDPTEPARGDKAFVIMGMIALIIFIVLLATCSGCGRLPNAERPRSVVQEYDAAVKLTVTCASGSQPFGSGVIVGPEHVVTALHVVACDGIITATEVNGTVTLMIVDQVHPLLDVARLQVAGTYRFRDARPRIWTVPAIGDEVCVVPGFPSRGRACGDVERGGTPTNFPHTATTEPGNSGGGVYDSRGRLVGIVTHLRQCVNGQFCGGKATAITSVPGVMP